MFGSAHLVLRLALAVVVCGVLPVSVQGNQLNDTGSNDHRTAAVILSVDHSNEILVGVTLSLRGSSIRADGSGRIVITDINPDGDGATNNTNALICRSEMLTSGGNWYLHPNQQTTDESYRIASNDIRGWHRSRFVDVYGHQLVGLRRDGRVASGGRPLEGVFTCDIPGDSNTPVSVGIYYPSEF